MAELVMEHSSKERFGQPQTGGFDEEDARLQRLQEMQMNDLGLERKNYIVSSDFREKLVPINYTQLEASRACNKPGTAEYKRAQADNALLGAWGNAANFKDEFTPEEGSDYFKDGMSALGNTHRQFLNSEVNHDALASGKSSRGDFSQRSRGGGYVGTRGGRQSAAARVVRLPPSLPTPDKFDVKPTATLPAHIRAIVNLPSDGNNPGRPTVRGSIAQNGAVPSTLSRGNLAQASAMRDDFRGNLASDKLKAMASPPRPSTTQNTPVPVSSWGFNKLASPDDFMNAFNISRGKPKAKLEQPLETTAQGPSEDTTKLLPVDTGKTNKGSANTTADSEVIFSKEIDEAPQLARLPTPVPTSAASKESFSQELADLDWNAAAEPVKSDLVPEQEVAVKSEPKSEQKTTDESRESSDFLEAQGLLARLASLSSLPADAIANFVALSRSLENAQQLPMNDATASSVKDFAPLVIADREIRENAQTAQSVSAVNKIASTTTAASTASPLLSAPKELTSSIVATALAVPQALSIEKELESSSIEVNTTNTGSTASAAPNVEGIAENLSQRQEEWANNVLGLPPIGGNLDKSVHSQGKYVAPEEVDIYSRGQTKKAHLLSEHLRPVSRFKNTQPSHVLSLSSEWSALQQVGSQLRLPASANTLQDPSTKPKDKHVLPGPTTGPPRMITDSDRRHTLEAKQTNDLNSPKHVQEAIISELKENPARQQENHLMQQETTPMEYMNASEQSKTMAQLETSFVPVSSTSPSQATVPLDRGFRAEHFTPDETPEIVSHTDLGNFYRLVMHHGGYTVKFFSPKRSIASTTSTAAIDTQSDASLDAQAITPTSYIEQSTTQGESSTERDLFNNYQRPEPGKYKPPNWLLSDPTLPKPGDAGSAMRAQLKASGVAIPDSVSFKVKEIHESAEKSQQPTWKAPRATKALGVKESGAISKPSLGSSTWSAPKTEPKAPASSFSGSIWAKPANDSSPVPSVYASPQPWGMAKPKPGPSADPGAAARAQYLRGGTLTDNIPKDPSTKRPHTNPAGASNEATVKRAKPDLW